jgi:hypothetical protein
MQDTVNLNDKASAGLSAGHAVDDKMRLHGTFHFKLHDKDGNLIREWSAPNLVTNLGRNKILDTAIGGVTQITAWYVGLIDNSGFSALAAADTLASHAGWTEAVGYTGNRQAYSPAAASSQSITNTASPAVFSMTGTATINGAFIASVATGTSGTLLSEASFGTAQPVISGNTLTVTYVLND